jgi:hypothetical protein
MRRAAQHRRENPGCEIVISWIAQNFDGQGSGRIDKTVVWKPLTRRRA